MQSSQSFIILLAITASLILIADRIKAEETEETIFGCTGKLFRKKVGGRNIEMIYHNLSNIKIPERFDAREKWPDCKTLYHIKYQGRCGGCWAFAAASVMADRLCIATRGKYDKNLSEQDLLECCSECVPEKKEYIGGCEGGYANVAFVNWEQNGLVTGFEGCKPTEESIKKGIPQKECRQRCTNESYKVDYKKDKTFSISTLITYIGQKSDIEHVMAEIMLNGPVAGNMRTYKYIKRVPPDSILKFNKSLIQSDESGEEHSIKIIGWDNINGTPVWIMANSWGTKWCNKGFCYIRRGYNDFDIELQYYAAIPREIPIEIPKRNNATKKKDKQTEKTESSGSNIINITDPIELAVILYILTM